MKVYTFSYEMQVPEGVVKGALVGAGVGTATSIIKQIKNKKLNVKDALKKAGIGALAGASVGATSSAIGEHVRHGKMRKLGYRVDHSGNAYFVDKKGNPHKVAIQKDGGELAYGGYLPTVHPNSVLKDKKGRPRLVTERHMRKLIHKLQRIDLPRDVDKNGAIVINPKKYNYDKEKMEAVIGHELGHKLKDRNSIKLRKGKLSQEEFLRLPSKVRQKSEIAADKYAVKRGANPSKLNKEILRITKEGLEKDHPKWAKETPEEEKNKQVYELNKQYRDTWLEKQAQKWDRKHSEETNNIQ